MKQEAAIRRRQLEAAQKTQQQQQQQIQQHDDLSSIRKETYIVAAEKPVLESPYKTIPEDLWDLDAEEEKDAFASESVVDDGHANANVGDVQDASTADVDFLEQFLGSTNTNLTNDLEALDQDTLGMFCFAFRFFLNCVFFSDFSSRLRKTIPMMIFVCRCSNVRATFCWLPSVLVNKLNLFASEEEVVVVHKKVRLATTTLISIKISMTINSPNNLPKLGLEPEALNRLIERQEHRWNC